MSYAKRFCKQIEKYNAHLMDKSAGTSKVKEKKALKERLYRFSVRRNPQTKGAAS